MVACRAKDFFNERSFEIRSAYATILEANKKEQEG